MNIEDWKFFSSLEGDLKHIIKIVFAVLGIATVHFWGFMSKFPPGVVGIVDYVLFAHFVFQFLIFFSLSLFFARSGVFAAYLVISIGFVYLSNAWEYIRLKFKFENVSCDTEIDSVSRDTEDKNKDTSRANAVNNFFLALEFITIVIWFLIFSFYYLFGEYSLDAILHAIFISMIVAWMIVSAYDIVLNFRVKVEDGGREESSVFVYFKKSHYSMLFIVFILTLAYWTGEIRFQNVAKRHLVTAVVAGKSAEVAALGWLSGGLLVFIPGEECDEFHVTSSTNPISARRCK